MTNDGLPEPRGVAKLMMRGGNVGIAAYMDWGVDGPPDAGETVYTADQLRAAIAQERERCAKLCEETAKQLYDQSPCIQEDESPDGAYACAAAIRGQAEGER